MGALSRKENKGNMITLRDLLETNGFLTDIDINLLNKDGKRIDAWHLGLAFGVVPPYPDIIRPCFTDSSGWRQTHYSRDSVNTYDDGTDYYKIKMSAIPKKLLDKPVHSWVSRYVFAKYHRRDINDAHSKGIEVWLLDESITNNYVPEEDKKKKEQKDEVLDGQMDIMSFMEE